jgi:hypothetical protein
MDLNDLMKNPEQIQQLISVLQALLPKDSTKSSTPDEAPAHDNEDGFSSAIKTKSSKKFKQRSASENKFLDMPERNMFKEDSKIDQILNKHPPVSRSREFATVEVVCRVCGKKEQVSPALAGEAPKRYKCNNCSTSAG